MTQRSDNRVKQSARKLVGTVLTLVSLVVYPLLGTLIYERFLTGAPWWVLLPYFVIAGLCWFFPASWIVRWMVRPDAPP